MEELVCWKIFVELFNTGTVAETAQRLSLESSTVSKKLTKLEKKLGVTLFDRTSRPFLPTPVAVKLFEDAKGIISSRQKISEYLSTSVNVDSQIIRMMVGNSQRNYLPSILSNYLKDNPNSKFNVISPIDLEEFKKRMADIALVSGNLNLPNYVLRSRGRMIFIPVASKSYLEKHGPINSPYELSRHLVFSNLYSSRYSFTVNYFLKKNNTVINVPQNQVIRWSNVEMAKEAVLNGLGISPCLPLFECIDELESGDLQIILDGWHRPSQENYVAIYKDDWCKPYLRNFSEFLANSLATIEGSCEERLKKIISPDLYAEISK